MLSSYLLYGSIIGLISTTIYALITHKIMKDNYVRINHIRQNNKKCNYLIIFSIIMLISVIVFILAI